MKLIRIGNAEFADGGVCASKGFGAEQNNGVLLISSDRRCTAAAAFTANRIKNAALSGAVEKLADGNVRAVIFGGTGSDADKICRTAAERLKAEENDVIAVSSEITVQDMPQTAVRFKLGGKVCTIGGMLCMNSSGAFVFLTSDTAVSAELLQLALDDTVKATLDRVCTDRNEQAYDMVCMLASGSADNKPLTKENTDFEAFENALYNVMLNLARMTACGYGRSGKLTECVVCGADTDKKAEIIAKAVMTSGHFREAVAGENAELGRILLALGSADTDADDAEIIISSENGSIEVCRKGEALPLSKEQAKTVLSGDELCIIITVGEGSGKAAVWSFRC